MAERAAGFPRPSHGACEGGRAASCRRGRRRVATRRRGPWPPRGLPARPTRAPGGTTGATRKRRARLALAGEAGPVWVPPERAGGLREPDRATGDLACVREAARQRAGAILCRHGMSWDERTPTGRPERRRCRRLRDRPRPVGLGDAGSQGTASRLSRPPSRPRSPATGRGPGPRGSPGPPARGRPSSRPCARGARGLPSALALAAEVGGLSHPSSGRRAASCLGLAPSGGPGAESRRLGRVPGSGRALVRRPLVEGAWVLARGNPACRKRGEASVPLAIREHARACPGRPLGRRREPVSRGPVPREANTATAAEMARMPPRVGRDAQEAAALAAEVALVA